MTCGSAEAGKKKRNSLELLRQRNATERWQKLQEKWQLPLEATDDVSNPAHSEGPAADDWPSETPVAVPPHSSAQNVPVEASSPFILPTPHPNVPQPARQQDPAKDPWILTPPEAQSNQKVADADPAWAFPQTDIGGSAAKRDAAQLVNLNQAQPRAGERARMQMRGIDDARPKPITSILPYYDYSPGGDAPCDVLCPRPEGCPPDAVTKPCPELVPLPEIPFESRAFAEAHVAWEASNLFSNPLYFEDAPLERYGHTHGPLLQPFVSLGKFGGQLVGLPYQMALHPIHEHRYALGWYRPGECAPYKYYLPPWNAKAAATAGAVYTGLFFLVP